MRGSFAPLVLENGVEIQVDYSKEIVLYEGGLASIQLLMTDEYYEAAVNFKAALDDLKDFEAERKDAREAGEKKYIEEHPFDADNVFVVSDASKKTREKDRRQAIKKKESVWRQSVIKAGRRAAEDVVKSRNGQLVASGLTDEMIRQVLNGSLDLNTGTMYWYPTTLDLVRMFKKSVRIPVQRFLEIDYNDDNPPPADPEYSRELLAESYYTAKTGVNVFDDIRDSFHTDPKKPWTKGPFPEVKRKRWESMVSRLHAVKRRLKITDPRKTYRDDDNMTYEGRTGMPCLWLETQVQGYPKNYNVLTADGIRVIYKDPLDTPTTAYFMSPSTLAQTIRSAINMKSKTIYLAMIKRTFENMSVLFEEAGRMFSQKSGTRRYFA